MLNEWIAKYNVQTAEDILRTKREILQYITLSGLSRSDFFSQASFYGGTALRIIYDQQRFSEDLDFSLNTKDEKFSLSNYFSFIEDECKMFNLDVNLALKNKINNSAIESAFLKDSTEWSEISFFSKSTNSDRAVKIKVEIDTNPPLSFETEPKLILFPHSFYVTCFQESFLFAGKMHAVLYREWKTRVKGRDWYDLEWYVRRKTKLNLAHLQERAIESQSIDKFATLTPSLFNEIIHNRIEHLDIENAKEDIIRFVINPSELNIWSKQYFHDLVDKIQIDS
ncbi:MAG TPA: nucleotidyl transferase AbiEii/AbiGii toxin family protein [Saprospiraceae bacterium]|mgnify:CR=1 FL=1|nr:nucleotidyl transferase AbiEii/AbiGii toxin family protein [Saprospiraceae bacterium]